MKKRLITGIGLALFCNGLVMSCAAGGPAVVSGSPPVQSQIQVSGGSNAADELDAAVRETSDYLNKQLPAGNKLVILNIQSDFPALSEYIIDELIANTVNDRVFSVVDRRQLDAIRSELDFQYSGEVDDDTMQALGRMAGAQIIVSGAVSRIGDLYRLRVRALSVQSAAIEGQFNRNIPDGPTIAALVKSQATGYGSGGNYGGASGTAAQTQATPSAPAPVLVQAEAPQPAAPATPPAPEPPKVYKIGDTGPAGGIVFYDMGFTMNGWRYLEAAPADIPGVWQWGAVGTKVRGTSNGIGNGKQNTKIILEVLNQTGETMKAAQVADSYEYGGFDDWFFPSKDELDLMYKNLKAKGLGGFQSGSYWTSSVNDTKYSSYNTSYQNFSNGEKKDDEDRANTSFYVRAIRQF
jgi:TolB-like protein